MLKDDKGNVLLNFSKNVGLKESNETKVLAILEALWLFYSSFHEGFISFYQSFKFCPPKLWLSSSMWVGSPMLWQMPQEKEGVDRVVPFIAHTL